MSRVAIASIGFAAVLLNFLPLPAQTALTIHGHPQKASYASPSEWPFVSGQGHWQPANPSGGIGHTHVECTAPIYAEIPRTSTLTLACRLQLFHVDGQIEALFGPLVRSVVWETPGPMVGNPMGVVLRNITVTFDPALSDPTNGAQRVPLTGWYINTLVARTRFFSGASTDVEMFMPFYAVTPGAAEEPGLHMRLGVHSCTQSPASVQSGHGCPLSQYLDDYVPIAPITTRITVPGHTSAYQIIEQFPGAGQLQQVNNADLHNGISGTLVQELNDPDPRHEIIGDVVFDPATLNPGVNKVGLVWNQCTGAGNTLFAAGECASTLLVLNVTNGNGTPPPPGPTPVDCAGVKSWLEFSPGLWHQVFTVTQQPTNGGKSCAVVVNGG